MNCDPQDKIIVTSMILMDNGFEYLHYNQWKNRINQAKLVNHGVGYTKHKSTRLDKQRQVYCDDDYYYKIWNVNNSSSWKLLQVIYLGLYDKSTAATLVGLLFNNNNKCIGYVTHSWPVATIQAYNILMNILEEKIQNTHYYYWDTKKGHVRQNNELVGLIDLDGCNHIFEKTRKHFKERLPYHPKHRKLILRLRKQFLEKNYE